MLTRRVRKAKAHLHDGEGSQILRGDELETAKLTEGFLVDEGLDFGVGDGEGLVQAGVLSGEGVSDSIPIHAANCEKRLSDGGARLTKSAGIGIVVGMAAILSGEVAKAREAIKAGFGRICLICAGSTSAHRAQSHRARRDAQVDSRGGGSCS